MFKRCPSCQASVLDDDAEACPFCGSPMDPAKAKGFKAASPAKPAAVSKPAAVGKPGGKTDATAERKPAAGTAAAGTAGTSRGGSPTAAPPKDNDDPFALAATTGNAIPLSPRRTPTHTNRIVCPMCETAGYAPTKASGKEVRCANPKCLVPEFKAPDFAAPKPVEPEPTPPFWTSPTFITFLAVAVILIGGGGFWFFALRKETPKQPTTPDIVEQPSTLTTPETETPTTQTPGEQTPDVPTGPSPSEVLASILDRMPVLAQDTAQSQRKTLRRRFAAEAYALAGRPKEAQEQLERLKALQGSQPFDNISPLVLLAWQQAAAGDETAAQQFFQQSAQLTGQIPSNGIDPARVLIEWAAAAVRFGKAEDAHRLIAAPRPADDDVSERLLAQLRSANLFNQAKLGVEEQAFPMRNWQNPKAVAVAFELLLHGRVEDAQTWVRNLSDLTAQTEARAAMAEYLATRKQTWADQQAAIEPLLSDSSPVQQAYVWARVATRLAASKAASAGDAFGHAKMQVTNLPATEPFPADRLLTLYQHEMPNQAELFLQATAAAEAAHASALLNQNDEAWNLLQNALTRLRSVGPAPDAIAERAAELDTLGISGVQNRLKSESNLNSDDEARRAANEYRRKLREAQDLSALRFRIQSEWLADAIGWGLGGKVLTEIQARSSAATVGEREPYLSGEAAERLVIAFQQAQNAAGLDALKGKVNGAAITSTQGLAFTVRAYLGQSQADRAARELSASRWVGVPRNEKLAVAVRAAGLIAADQPKVALTFGKSIGDEMIREEVLRSVGYTAGRVGKGPEVFQAMKTLTFVVTEESSLLRGLVGGMSEAGLRESASPTAQRSQIRGERAVPVAGISVRP